MNLKRLVPNSLITLLVSMFVPINQIANAEEVWRHLDASGKDVKK
jgi:hypothetical protein